MKRFYKVVDVSKDKNGYTINLDGKPVKTPSRATLCVPTLVLAEEIMKEWMEQEGEIVPDSMPLTQIVTTMQDRVKIERPAMQKAVLKYLDTDLICYRTEEPPELAEMQSAHWDLWLNWAESRFECKAKTTTGLQALQQDQALHDRVSQAVSELDDAHFTVLQIVVPLCGSLIMGLAMVEKALKADQLFIASTLEETHKAKLYNEEKYGSDPAQEKRFQNMKRDLNAVETFLSLI